MAAFSIGKPITTTVPVIAVDAGGGKVVQYVWTYLGPSNLG